jgi:hypothetical protein
MSWKTILGIFAGVVAVAVMLGASLFGVEPIAMLAVAVLALAICVAVPG